MSGTFDKLTFKSVTVRAVSVPLKLAIVSKVGRFDHWPLILIDLYTEEGIIGRSYLEPYLAHALGPIATVIRELAARRAGRAISPVDDFREGQRALTLIGNEGASMIAISPNAGNVTAILRRPGSRVSRRKSTGHSRRWADTGSGSSRVRSSLSQLRRVAPSSSTGSIRMAIAPGAVGSEQARGH